MRIKRRADEKSLSSSFALSEVWVRPFVGKTITHYLTAGDAKDVAEIIEENIEKGIVVNYYGLGVGVICDGVGFGSVTIL